MESSAWSTGSRQRKNLQVPSAACKIGNPTKIFGRDLKKSEAQEPRGRFRPTAIVLCDGARAEPAWQGRGVEGSYRMGKETAGDQAFRVPRVSRADG